MAALALAVALGCAGAPRKPDAFYSPPDAHARPGSPATCCAPSRSRTGPDGARSWRILYRSTGMKGEPVAVSAMLVVPDGPAPAAGRERGGLGAPHHRRGPGLRAVAAAELAEDHPRASTRW